jgi:glutamate-ammonia-ligase adenylyltransferase
LGKWGAHELGLKSDLDFIFVTPGPPTVDDNKVARKFITHLTAAHRGGTLYMVDLRLRPSGQSGPLIVSISNLCSYLANEAAAWERQSYLRARFINSGLELNNLNAIDEVQKNNLLRRLTPNDWQSLAEIRQQLIRHKASQNPNNEDLKFAPGGLFDIELAMQAATLEHQLQVTSGISTVQLISSLEQTGGVWAAAGPTLKENYTFLRQIEQMHQLVYQHGGAKLHSETNNNFTRLAKAFNKTPEQLQKQIQNRLNQSLEILKRLDPRLKA